MSGRERNEQRDEEGEDGCSHSALVSVLGGWRNFICGVRRVRLTRPRMSTLADLTAQLSAGRDLVPAQVELAAAMLAAPIEPDEAKGDFLAALAKKGETAGEIAAFATAFRARAVNPGGEAWSARGGVAARTYAMMLGVSRGHAV